jgi:ATP synthase protein I
MTDKPEDMDGLVQTAKRESERHRRWLAEGEPGVGRRLAQIGVLGWMIVVPMLAGMALGRWLDGIRHSGVFWTAPLLMIGLGFGCWSAWKWIQRS